MSDTPRNDDVRKFVKDTFHRNAGVAEIQGLSMTLLLDIHQELERINNNLEKDQ